MHKKIKIVKAPAPPGSTEQNQAYPEYKIPTKFAASPQTLKAIEDEIGKFRELKNSNLQGPLKNISISAYKQKDPDTGEKVTLAQVYNFTINGKSSPDYYKGHCFKGRIEFPDNYPKSPPVLFVNFLEKGRPFRMVNLYLDGRVCHHCVNPEYYKYPKFDVPYIMKELENMFYTPNSLDSANMGLGDYYEEYPNEYWEFQREQAQKLPLAKE